MRVGYSKITYKSVCSQIVSEQPSALCLVYQLKNTFVDNHRLPNRSFVVSCHTLFSQCYFRGVTLQKGVSTYYFLQYHSFVKKFSILDHLVRMFLRSCVALTRFNFHVSYEDTCMSAIMTKSLLYHSELSATNLVFRVTEGVFDRFSAAKLCHAGWMYHLVWSALLHWLQDNTPDQMQVMKVS